MMKKARIVAGSRPDYRNFAIETLNEDDTGTW